jgi:dTDP-4-amino-4,6-dideoxygalactose transaminase
MSIPTSKVASLAIFGAAPVLPALARLGQHNFPSWGRYESVFRDIFEREYYTNHGPLAQKLEARLANMLQVGHAICMTNSTIALAMAAQALGVKGKVAVPAFSFINTARSLMWANVQPTWCDVSRATGHLSPEFVEPLLKRHEVTGILAANLWGDAAEVEALHELAVSYDVPLYFDSAQAFGCEISGKPIGGNGRLEVISFHSNQIINAAEGAVICTNDDDLAAHIRNIRSNYGMGRPVPVGKTGNGRLSEAQAAIALMSLDDYPMLAERNKALFDAYARMLAEVSGLRLRRPMHVSRSNYQNVVFEFDPDAFGLSRDMLIEVLQAENIEASGGLESPARRELLSTASDEVLPNARFWFDSAIELPCGSGVEMSTVERIAEVIFNVQRQAGQIARELRV